MTHKLGFQRFVQHAWGEQQIRTKWLPKHFSNLREMGVDAWTEFIQPSVRRNGGLSDNNNEHGVSITAWNLQTWWASTFQAPYTKKLLYTASRSNIQSKQSFLWKQADLSVLCMTCLVYKHWSLYTSFSSCGRSARDVSCHNTTLLLPLQQKNVTMAHGFKPWALQPDIMRRPWPHL